MPLSELPSPRREFVGDFPEERLGSRVPTAEGKEPDQAARERYLDPDEAVRPVRVDGKRMPEQGDPAAGIRAAEEDHLPARRDRRIELPPAWERPAGRGFGRPRTP